jgi:hypothetical protein
MEKEKLQQIKDQNEYGKEMFNLAIDCAIDIVEDFYKGHTDPPHEEIISKLKELKKV